MRKYRRNKKRLNYKKIFVLILILGIIIIFFKNIKNDNKKTLEAKANYIEYDDKNNKILEELNSTNKNEAIVVNQSENENNTNKINELPKINLKELKNEEKLGSEGLTVLMYHFFYDKSKGETPKDGNWLEIGDFENHLKYLTENQYYFPSWDEVAEYVDGKTPLPKKSIVLTVDDGEESFFRVALPVIKKYDVKVTNFLVTSWNGWFKNDYKADQMYYQSHSDDMHKAGTNGKGVMRSWSYEQILKDCKQSRQVLGDDCVAFCYPFGQFNDTSKKAVKDAGFKLAFTTQAGRVKAGSDAYALPRVRTSTKTTLSVLKELIN